MPFSFYLIGLAGFFPVLALAQHQHSSAADTGKVYKFTEHTDIWLETNLRGRSFDAYWLSIRPDGGMLVKCSNPGGYVWDGCTPKFRLLGRIAGTPDGRTDPRTGKPVTYYASMVHDVLFHYGLLKDKQLPISRHEADRLFAMLLKQAGFRWWRVYYAGVRIGGGIYGRWYRRGYEGPVSVQRVSWGVE